MDIGGRSMLARVVRRSQRAEQVDKVVVATVDAPAEDAIVVECRRLGIGFSRGSDEDVLERSEKTADEHGADIIVRITSDCPLIEPAIIDRTIIAFKENCPDYASNSIEATYPRGLDVEVFSRDALRQAAKKAHKPYERAHVTPYIYQHPTEFKLLSIKSDIDRSRLRWTVDTPADLQFARAVYGHFNDADEFSWTDVLQLLADQPELVKINENVRQKALEEG